MNAFRLITVGVDGSAGGRRALAWALRLASATGATVEVVTAWSWDGVSFSPGLTGTREEERSTVAKHQKHDIDAALKDFDGPVPTVSTQLIEGNPAPVLIEAARTSDLLVLGSHGRGHLATALLGSVGEACVRHGSTPVVIVPAHDRSKQAEESLVQA